MIAYSYAFSTANIINTLDLSI